MTWTRTGHSKNTNINATLNLALKKFKFKRNKELPHELADILIVGQFGFSKIKVQKYKDAGKQIVSQLSAEEFFYEKYPEYFL